MRRIDEWPKKRREKPIHPTYSYSISPLALFLREGETMANLGRQKARGTLALNVLLIKTSIARIGLTLARFTQAQPIVRPAMQVASGLDPENAIK